jgi:hypothetical protein
MLLLAMMVELNTGYAPHVSFVFLVPEDLFETYTAPQAEKLKKVFETIDIFVVSIADGFLNSKKENFYSVWNLTSSESSFNKKNVSFPNKQPLNSFFPLPSFSHSQGLQPLIDTYRLFKKLDEEIPPKNVSLEDPFFKILDKIQIWGGMEISVSHDEKKIIVEKVKKMEKEKEIEWNEKKIIFENVKKMEKEKEIEWSEENCENKNCSEEDTLKRKKKTKRSWEEVESEESEEKEGMLNNKKRFKPNDSFQTLFQDLFTKSGSISSSSSSKPNSKNTSNLSPISKSNSIFSPSNSKSSSKNTSSSSKKTSISSSSKKSSTSITSKKKPSLFSSPISKNKYMLDYYFKPGSISSSSSSAPVSIESSIFTNNSSSANGSTTNPTLEKKPISSPVFTNSSISSSAPVFIDGSISANSSTSSSIPVSIDISLDTQIKFSKYFSKEFICKVIFCLIFNVSGVQDSETDNDNKYILDIFVEDENSKMINDNLLKRIEQLLNFFENLSNISFDI